MALCWGTGELQMGGQEHFYLETQGLIAVPKGENGELDLFVASQHAAYTQVRKVFKDALCQILPSFGIRTMWTQLRTILQDKLILSGRR